MTRARPRKRPCRVCRKWFLPDPRLKDRQATCGDPACRREWHRRKCRQWNRENQDYFRSNYLPKRLDDAVVSQDKPMKTGLNAGLPLKFIQGVITIQQFVMIQYLVRLFVKRLASRPQTPKATYDTG